MAIPSRLAYVHTKRKNERHSISLTHSASHSFIHVLTYQLNLTRNLFLLLAHILYLARRREGNYFGATRRKDCGSAGGCAEGPARVLRVPGQSALPHIHNGRTQEEQTRILMGSVCEIGCKDSFPIQKKRREEGIRKRKVSC